MVCPHLLARILSAVAALLMSAATAAASDSPQASRPRYVSPATVQAWLSEGSPVTFLDVREADEFAAGHIPVAVNIPHEDVASLADQLPRDQTIVLYCIHSAHRAPQAAQTLGALGFTNVYVLEGGIVAWQANGLTIRARNAVGPPTILPKTERCEPKAAL
jgi:thiosulfate sulfurtransferase